MKIAEKVSATLLLILTLILFAIFLVVIGLFVTYMYQNYPSDLAIMGVIAVPLSYPFIVLYTLYERTWKAVVLLILFTVLLAVTLNWGNSLGVTIHSVVESFLTK